MSIVPFLCQAHLKMNQIPTSTVYFQFQACVKMKPMSMVLFPVSSLLKNEMASHEHGSISHVKLIKK